MLHEPSPTGMEQHILSQYHCALYIATQFTSLAVHNFHGKPDHHRQERCHGMVYEFGKLMFVNHMGHLLMAGRLRQPTDEKCFAAL